MDKDERDEAKRATEQSRARRLGQRMAGKVRQKRMAEAGLETRSVRHALARMTRPRGRKGEKASIVVARSAAEKVDEARARARSTIRAKHSRAGVMPHVARNPEKKRAEVARRDAWRAEWGQRLRA